MICVYCGRDAGVGSVHAANVCGSCDCGYKVSYPVSPNLPPTIRKWEEHDIEYRRFMGKVPLASTRSLVPPNQMCSSCGSWGYRYNEPEFCPCYDKHFVKRSDGGEKPSS